MQIIHKVKEHSNYEIIDRFKELKDEFTKTSELLAKQNKRKSKIHISNRYHINRWSR